MRPRWLGIAVSRNSSRHCVENEINRLQVEQAEDQVADQLRRTGIHRMISFLTGIILWFNRLANTFGSIVLAPIRYLPGWCSATLVAVVTGILMLLIFKYTSNQTAIRRTRNDIKANLLSLSLFRDNVWLSLRSQGRILLAAVPSVPVGGCPDAGDGHPDVSLARATGTLVPGPASPGRSGGVRRDGAQPECSMAAPSSSSQLPPSKSPPVPFALKPIICSAGASEHSRPVTMI